MDKLPDLLADNLRVIFVGTAAGLRSSERGHYYAGPGNRFWSAIHETGLTPKLFKPEEFPNLLPIGIGLTDLSKLGAGMDHQIKSHQYDVSRFIATIRRHNPRAVAFTGKKAASIWLNRKSTREIKYGRLRSLPYSFPDVFVLPSPSGAARSHWSITPWREMAEWLEAAS